ncbi:hypothetical protein VPH35_094112 [Triticum aestivum]
MLSRSPALPLLTATEDSDPPAFYFQPNPEWGSCYVPLFCDLSTSSSGILSNKKLGTRLSVQPNIQDAQAATVVDAGDRKTWEECKKILTSLKLSSEDAKKMLKKALGWIHWPYWTEERKKEVPSTEVVNGVLDYIRALGLSDDDLYKLFKKFPEALRCDLESKVKLNVGKLDSDGGINGKTLQSVLLRNPKVLGYNVDCRGDCAAQCTGFLVRF